MVSLLLTSVDNCEVMVTGYGIRAFNHDVEHKCLALAIEFTKSGLRLTVI
jgi:hypothetical protein